MVSDGEPIVVSLSEAASASPDQESLLPADATKIVRNVVSPTLTVYLPSASTRTGAGVVVCPGGAFRFLSIEHEGTDVAHWLVERGVAAFVLRYRVAPTPVSEEDFHRYLQSVFSRPIDAGESAREAMEKVISLAVEDGGQALTVVRQHAPEWGLDPSRIGVVGFSAGGILATRLAVGQDASRRPDFVAPIYGAPFEDEIVPADAPPAFIAVCDDDRMAAGRSIPLAAAWREAGRPVELHLYATGGHGFGMRRRGLPVDTWIERFFEWMRSQEIV